METRAHYVLIGAGVLASMALAFFFVLWLGPNRVQYDLYDVRFTDRVSGLTVGAPVRFNGIQKGEVRRLSIDENDPSIVLARIRVEDDTPVHADTRAELELVGFTGLAVIQLSGGSKDQPLLKNIERGVPVIPADTSGFAAFLEGSGDIVNAVNRLLSEDNTEAVRRILMNVDAATAAVADNDEEIRALVQDAAAISKNLADATEKISRAAESLDAILSDGAPGALAETEAAARELRAVLRNFDGILDENRDALALFTTQGLTQVGPAFAEARRTLRSLDEILRELDRDPKGFLLGESTPLRKGESE